MSSGPYPSFDRQTETRLPPHSDSQAFRFRVTVALEPVVDSEEAAKFLNINPKTLQKLARNNEVPGYRIGKLWKFRLSDLDAWLRSKVISKGPSAASLPDPGDRPLDKPHSMGLL